MCRLIYVFELEVILLIKIKNGKPKMLTIVTFRVSVFRDGLRAHRQTKLLITANFKVSIFRERMRTFRKKLLSSFVSNALKEV